MRFTFDHDHVLLAEAVRELLAKECTPADVRAAWNDEKERSPERWRKLAEMGVAGLTAPESHGGLGMDEVGLVCVLEETGRAALPEPVVEHTAVAVPLLGDIGGEVADAWLGKAAAGTALLSVGLAAMPFVVEADAADLLVLEGEGGLHAVGRDGVVLTPQPSIDGARRLFSVAWEPATATALLTGAAAAAAASLAFDRGALGASAQLLGVAQHLIDVTADYARERHQFGQPIGSFQAVKHHLANALGALELARPVVYRAAWSVAHDDPTRGVDVSMAKAYASDAANVAARVALQVHGAIGYTWECDLHLWMKRAWALGAAWGDARWHRRRVGDAVIDRGSSARF
jgi:alkylation response protein AidB-like acyl-CoA dehydrogenase